MLSYQGYRIPFTKNSYNHIKNDLTVSPIVFGDYAIPNTRFTVFKYDTDYIWVPKYYGLEKFGQPDNILERHGDVVNLDFKGQLKSPQIPVVQQVIDTLDKHDSTVLSIFPGFGKTICTLYIISQIRKKTLIIVHKEFLLNQWIERIREFLPQAKIGIIQKDKVDIENKDIVIAMLQSITVRKKQYPPSTFDSFGFLAVDECHRICSKTFSKALFQISTKKMLGLSATPDRKDGLSCVLTWFLRSITHPVLDNSIQLIPHVTKIVAQYQSPPLVKFNLRGKVNLPNLVTQISLDPLRNKQIIDQIILLNRLQRKILVLTERREQCNTLCNLLPDHISGGLYLGGMKESDLNTSNKKDVIFATYSMAAEGYDNKELDTLIMASGRSDIEQIVGRITRQKNSNHPMIVDFYDDIEGIRQQFYKRLRFYKKKKFILPNKTEQPSLPGYDSNPDSDCDSHTQQNSENPFIT